MPAVVTPLPTSPHYQGACALSFSAAFFLAGLVTYSAAAFALMVPLNLATLAIVGTGALLWSAIGFACGAYYSLRAYVRRLRELKTAMDRIAGESPPEG